MLNRDPFSLALEPFFMTLLAAARIAGKVQAAPQEFQPFKNMVDMVATSLVHVNSIRATIYGSSARLDRIDEQLQVIESGIDDAKKVTTRFVISRNTDDTLVTTSDRLEWYFFWRNIAEANMVPLAIWKGDLADIERELRSEQERPEMKYFKDIDEQFWKVTLRRAETHSVLYSGRGERLSRSLVVSPNTFHLFADTRTRGNSFLIYAVDKIVIINSAHRCGLPLRNRRIWNMI